jgi:MFS family permease
VSEARRPPAWTWLLLTEEAVVTAGGQFREVALPLLMVALWPSARSYALAQGVVLLPQVLLAGPFGRLADRMPARAVLIASYLVRAAALAVLLGAHTLPVAMVGLVLLAFGTGAYTPAMAHYQAGDGAGQATALLGRLRMVAALAQAVLPLVAGVAMAAGGRGLGFVVSLAAYLLATAVMLGLPARPPAAPRRAPAPGRRQWCRARSGVPCWWSRR